MSELRIQLLKDIMVMCIFLVVFFGSIVLIKLFPSFKKLIIAIKNAWGKWRFKQLTKETLLDKVLKGDYKEYNELTGKNGGDKNEDKRKK
jgi:hypothetical protein